MRGPVAEGAKIIAGRNESPAKVALPDPVHHHPGGEGVFRAGNPLGQLKPAALRCTRRSAGLPSLGAITVKVSPPGICNTGYSTHIDVSCRSARVSVLRKIPASE